MSALILKAANEFSNLFLGTSRSDDSVGDRLSYRYTCAILVAFTIIVSNREFTSKRIQCWVPAFFNSNYEEYTNNVCWVRNTYYIEDEKQIPDSTDLRHFSSIRYYQWIPFILLFQAFLFFVPYLVWRILCQRSGIDIRDIVDAASSYKKANDEKQRIRLMKFIILVMDQYVDDPRRQSNNRETVWWKKFFLVFFPSSGRYMGDYLRNLFLFVKILYVANVVLQVYLLTLLLGQPFWSLGLTVVRLLYEGKGWDFSSQYFPKVTLCDFQIREANALPIAHTYTVMCVLPINLFNQQIFTFLWFWFVFVILLTVYDLCIWIYRLFFRRNAYIEERLKVMEYELTMKWPYWSSCAHHVNIEDMNQLKSVQSRDETVSPNPDDNVRILSDGRKVHHQSRMYLVPDEYYEGEGQSILNFFNYEYLEADGHFILRIIGANASEFVSTKILHDLYELCCERRFSPCKVEKLERLPRTTLYKYLCIPKEGRQPQEEQPKTPSEETHPSINPFKSRMLDERPEVKRRTSHNPSYAEHGPRARSDTQPFLDQTEDLQQLSTMRSGNGSSTARRVQYQPPDHKEEDDQHL